MQMKINAIKQEYLSDEGLTIVELRKLLEYKLSLGDYDRIPGRNTTMKMNGLVKKWNEFISIDNYSII